MGDSDAAKPVIGRLNSRMPQDLIEVIDNLARGAGVSRSKQIENMVREWLSLNVGSHYRPGSDPILLQAHGRPTTDEKMLSKLAHAFGLNYNGILRKELAQLRGSGEIDLASVVARIQAILNEVGEASGLSQEQVQIFGPDPGREGDG